MSGIMSMFSNALGLGGAPATPAPGAQAPAATPGAIPATAPNTGAASPNTGANGVIPQTGDNISPAPATPLDQFSELWKTPEVPAGGQPPGVFGNVDPKRFMEAAGKIDFAKVVTPEQLQAISQGGEAAVGAFASALNSVAQTTYAQSAFASTKIVEQAMARSRENFLAELPSHIKQQTVKESLRAENPIFSNPAVQPIISALESQMAVKFPQATAGELTQMAKTYVEALGTSFAPKAPEAPKARGTKDATDWSQFLAD